MSRHRRQQRKRARLRREMDQWMERYYAWGIGFGVALEDFGRAIELDHSEAMSRIEARGEQITLAALYSELAKVVRGAT